jgi:gamma-glutamylcyclotransferase (GGCT)/AIG2-like uncharacterized protein YtfP
VRDNGLHSPRRIAASRWSQSFTDGICELSEHLPIFVYGTLKHGESRELNWPRPTLKIERATTRGRIYNLGSYPAMTEGIEKIEGELWYVLSDDLEVTLAALDEIECYGNNDIDLYVRRIVQCELENGEVQRAHTYFFANPNELVDRPAILSDHDGRCRWTGQSTSE